MTDDLISRHAAINTLEELKELDYELYIRTGYCHLMEDHWDFVIKRYKEAIKETPCAQQKTGQWKEIAQHIKKDGIITTDYICSFCGAVVGDIPFDFIYAINRFCPKCGAKMEKMEENKHE